MDAKIKLILGEQAFAIAALQFQLETVTKERDDLKVSLDRMAMRKPPEALK